MPAQPDETLEAPVYEPPEPRVSLLAMVALLPGIAALVALVYCNVPSCPFRKELLLLPGALAVAGLLLGRLARRRIEHFPRVLTGRGVATAAQLVGLVVLLLTLACSVLPEVPRVMPHPKRANCKSNLRQIGLACHLYADDNGECFPPNLATLCPKYVDNAKPFSCPANPSKWKEGKTSGKFTRESTSYVYVAGVMATDPGECVVAFDRLENHKGVGRNVVFADAHVAWMNKPLAGGPDEFEALLEKTREAVKKRGGEIKLVGE